MEDKNISQYVFNALNELKQIAKEKYELMKQRMGFGR